MKYSVLAGLLAALIACSQDELLMTQKRLYKMFLFPNYLLKTFPCD